MSKVSIVIRTKNEEKFIGKTLEMVFSQTFQDIEVIIVDSGSTDGSLDIVKRFKSRIISIKPEEFTYGYALNIGASAAEGDFIVNLSAHAVPTNVKWLCCMLRNFSNKTVAGVYGRQIPFPDANPLAKRDFSKRYGEERRIQISDPFFSNVNGMIRKKVWEEFKFDETMPYCEDIDWARRVQKFGYSIGYDPDSVVYHSHNETLFQIFNRAKNLALGMKMIDPSLRMRFFGLRTWTYLVLEDIKYLYNNDQSLKYFMISPFYRLVESFGLYKGYLN